MRQAEAGSAARDGSGRGRWSPSGREGGCRDGSGGTAGNPPSPEISFLWSQRHLLMLSFGARAPAAESGGAKGSLGFDSCHNDRDNRVTPDKEPPPGNLGQVTSL